jgi:hypothetical protein
MPLKKNALIIFFKYKGFMKKKGHTPITRVKNPEPPIDDPRLDHLGCLGQIVSLLKR